MIILALALLVLAVSILLNLYGQYKHNKMLTRLYTGNVWQKELRGPRNRLYVYAVGDYHLHDVPN